jgi:hypothetical protein
VELTLSEGSSSTVAATLISDLRPYAEIKQSVYHTRSAAGPPALFQLMATASEWAALAFATGFVAKLGQISAEKLVAEVKKHFSSGSKASPLAIALKKVKDTVDTDSSVIIGLQFPDDFWGTTLSINGESLEEIVVEVSVFLASVEIIYEAIKVEIDVGKAPLGRIQIFIEEQGCSIRVRWMDQSFKNHEVQFR